MGGIGGWIAENILGNTNKFNAREAPVNAGNFAYGGVGGADEAANRYRNMAQGAQGRQGPQANYGEANTYQAAGQGARRGQVNLANAMAGRASGAVPSIAGMQAQQDMQRAAAAQASAAAGARGPAGLALAQQQAANQTANVHGQISNAAQINAANERLQAEQAAFGAMSGLRQTDQSSEGMAGQRAQFQAGLQQQQRGLNDAMTLGMTGFEHGVRQADLAGHQNYEQLNAANRQGTNAINAGVAGQNASAAGAAAMGGIQAAGQTAGAAFGLGNPPGKAAGGPVAVGTPYLVGEEGPELIVPMNDGMVIPAGPTKKILGRAEGGPVSGLRPSDVVLSTWGASPAGPEPAMEGALANAGYRMWQGRTNELLADKGANQRELDRVAHLRAVSPDLVNDEDLQLERAAKARAGIARKDEAKRVIEAAKEPAKEKPETPEKVTMASRMKAGLGALASSAGKAADSVDTAYHGPSSGYVPPQLIQVRADGGPVKGLQDLTASAPAHAHIEEAAQHYRPYAKSTVIHDTAAEKEAYYKDLSNQADALIAAMRDPLGRGATVPIEVDEVEDAPGPANWLVEYMSQREPVKVAARAFGGPIQGLQFGAINPMAGPATPSFDKVGPGGGMDVLGSLKAHSDFATRFQRQPGAGPMAYGAREEGGPVQGVKVVAPGEKGPELVTSSLYTPYEEPPEAKRVRQEHIQRRGRIGDVTVGVSANEGPPKVIARDDTDGIYAVEGPTGEILRTDPATATPGLAPQAKEKMAGLSGARISQLINALFHPRTSGR